MSENNRYKAVICGEEYTIIGRETKLHMDMVTKLLNEQVGEIKRLAPNTTSEQAAILVAINAVSDQIKKQEEILNLKKENENLKELASEVGKLQERLEKFEHVELEAKEKLLDLGQENDAIDSHVDAQRILNTAARKKIREKSNF